MTDSQLWVPPSVERTRQQYRKETAPPRGNAFGVWAGRQDLGALTLPGGGVLQFDLNRLTLSDLRGMRTHYQINISLAALTFLMHQVEWRINCKDKRIADAAEENLRRRWTALTRGMSQSYWAGFSPMVVDWENNPITSRVEFSNFKDLIPEECRVHWKEVDGYSTNPSNMKPRFLEYDGIDQGSWIGSLLDGSYLDGRQRRNTSNGSSGSIPADSTLWYPLLMENGDHYGRKLLRPAFPAWYFSQLIHLFANRYYERFGEPLPVGRAPFDEELNMPDGTVKNGRDAMTTILSGIRNRSVMVLPNDLQPQQAGAHTKPVYDYEIEYLESQMRGADFERYLSRLDEEISLALFTPLLMMRTSDVGSYNLGVTHAQMYLWMFNALASDWKQNIDDHLLNNFVNFNFGTKAPRATWEFHKGGKQDPETVRAIITALINGGQAQVDADELGTAIGMTVTEIKQVLEPPANPTDPNAPPAKKVDPRAGRVRNDPKASGPRGVGKTRATGKKISARVAGQVTKAFRDGTFDVPHLTMGYRRQFEDALILDGFDEAVATDKAEAIYGRTGAWMVEAVEIGADAYAGPDEFTAIFERVFESMIEELV